MNFSKLVSFLTFYGPPISHMVPLYPLRSCVRVVRSERAGMGKSLYIQRLEEKLEAKTQQGPHRVIIPVHGPKVTFGSIVQALKYPFEKTTNQDSDHGIIFHLDISPSVRIFNSVIDIIFAIHRY